MENLGSTFVFVDFGFNFTFNIFVAIVKKKQILCSDEN